MFMFNISYNCVIIDSAKLAVFKNDNIATQCKLNLTYFRVMEKTNVIITCDNIKNNAGRNWEFLFGSINNQKSNIINETFIVTLEPFPLKNLTKFNLTINDNITSVSIFVPDCDQVAETKYVTYKCDMNKETKSSPFENCTITCPVEPGRNQIVTVIRSPIARYDGAQNANGTFREETRTDNFNIRKKYFTISKFTKTKGFILFRTFFQLNISSMTRMINIFDFINNGKDRL
jgi:hypothetical protein